MIVTFYHMKWKNAPQLCEGHFYSNMFLVYRYVLLSLLQVMYHRVVVLYPHVGLMLYFHDKFE